MSKLLWCEDSGSGYQFWSAIGKELFPEIHIETKGNNTNLRKAASKIAADGNQYFILMDTPIDNPDVLREAKGLKRAVSGKNNVYIIHLHSFEYALLSFDLLDQWVFAEEDALKEKRKSWLLLRTLFLKLISTGGDEADLVDFKKWLEGFRNKNSEQIAAKLLYEITRNTGFETDKSKLGECFVVSCCEWDARQDDDICGLDPNRIDSHEKARLLVEHSALKKAFEEGGLI